jgi:hypothetical protein
LNVDAVTDGINVVYQKVTSYVPGRQSQIVWNPGTGELQLAAPTTASVKSGTSYTARNGWTAFRRVDSSGNAQIWTRSPAGELTAVSPIGVGSIVELSDDGAVMYLQGTRRYLAEPGAAPRNVASNQGSVIWRDGSFVLLLGRTALRITR